MLTVLNKYSHGYVIAPVVLALHNHHIINFFSAGISPEDLYEHVSFNPGNFKVAVRMLESIGWLQYNNGVFSWKDGAPLPESIPPEIYDIYGVPFEKLLSKDSLSLSELLIAYKASELLPKLSQKQEDPLLKMALESAFVLPFFYCLKVLGYSGNTIPAALSNREDSEALFHFLEEAELGSSDGETFVLNAVGASLLEGIGKAGVTLSYRSMLYKAEELIFGDAASVFSSDDEELHLDRALNVIGSGSQHGIFFQDMVRLLGELYERDETSSGFTLVDMGCGDGTLLKAAYEAMRRDATGISADGVVGVDLSKEALEEAKKTLGDIPHELLLGDIAQPDGFMSVLQDKGISTEDVLHVRTFLDHNCPLTVTPEDGVSVSYEDNRKYGIFVGRNGEEISPATIQENYRQHFARWREITGKKGLVTLEVYSLPPSTIKKYFEETESLHFDCLHGFSRQFLLSAPSYLMAAAGAGLLVQPEGFKKYPRLLPYTRISLQHFVPRSFTIRHPAPSDLDTLMYLEKATLPESLQTGRSNIDRRIENNPEGIYMVEQDGVCAGILYTQRIASENSLKEMTYDSLEQHHDPDGNIVQLISLQVHPDFQGSGISGELLSFGLLHNFVKSNVKKIVGLSRCACFRGTPEEYAEYATRKNKFGHPADPILAMHAGEGAEIVGLVPGFREADTDNLGHGIHIRYQYRKWAAGKSKVLN